MTPKKSRRGAKPPRFAGRVPEAPPPRSTDDETPKFCLHFLRPDFDVHALKPERQVAFAKTLQKLAGMTWQQITLADRHGNGSEQIKRDSIKAPIPVRFEDAEKFLVLRYAGKLPMAGVRIGAVYHVLWIEPEFNHLYDHG